jgi:hypothetical protein
VTAGLADLAAPLSRPAIQLFGDAAPLSGPAIQFFGDAAPWSGPAIQFSSDAVPWSGPTIQFFGDITPLSRPAIQLFVHTTPLSGPTEPLFSLTDQRSGHLRASFGVLYFFPWASLQPLSSLSLPASDSRHCSRPKRVEHRSCAAACSAPDAPLSDKSRLVLASNPGRPLTFLRKPSSCRWSLARGETFWDGERAFPSRSQARYLRSRQLLTRSG